nr:flagellin [uncultured Campylobacter sp.]
MAMTIGSADYTTGLQNKYMSNAQSSASKALGNISALRALSGTDTANLAIADALRSDANGARQGLANANDAIGMMQIADGALSSLNDATNRMSELSVRAVNGVKLDANGNIDPSSMNTDYQKAISSEMSALKESMQGSIDQATFNGKSVFGGQLNFETTSGVIGVNVEAPNLNQLDISNPQSIKDLRDTINRMRSDIGAAQNNIASNAESIAIKNINLTASESQLQNSDIAKNYSDLQASNMQLNAATIASAHNFASLQNKVAALLA